MPRAPLTLSLAAALMLAVPVVAGSPPACRYDDEPAPATGDQWRLSPVDTIHRLPADFVPSDLVSVRSTGLADDRLLRADVVQDLAQLLAEAAQAGHQYELQSAYRSYSYQEQVFSGWVESLGREQALRTSARPGHSEHQLGTTLDLRSHGGPPPWDLANWAATEEGAWLEENAWRFGFVMSYPEGEEQSTCYAYEPWHYRWIGREEAARQQQSGLVLREWLWSRLEREGQ